jgi:hypothetical protein
MHDRLRHPCSAVDNEGYHSLVGLAAKTPYTLLAESELHPTATISNTVRGPVALC